MSDPDVVVIGAGITGLTCAYRLQQLGISTMVLESSDRIGGVIRSERSGPYLLEWGPGSLLPTAHTFELLKELGLEDDLIEANPRSPRYIVVKGQLRRVPLGPMTFRGIARALMEPLIRSKSKADPAGESVARFFTRRFGREAHDRLVSPFVTGIFAGDTEKLGVAEVFPRIVDIEQQFGSVIVGMLRGKPKRDDQSKPRRSTVSSFAEGLEALPRRMAKGLNIQTRCERVRIGVDLHPRATVLAIPAYRAAEVLVEAHPEISETLAAIEYAPIVVAFTSIAEESLPAPLRGFGFLAPRSERLSILGTIFSSVLFPGRAPDGRILLTSFLGGALNPEVFDWPDERVWHVVGAELKQVLKARLQPEPVSLIRHRRAIPQYNIGHGRRIEGLAAMLQKSPGLFITGNFLHGVSVPACMEHGDQAASAVAEFLGAKP